MNYIVATTSSYEGFAAYLMFMLIAAVVLGVAGVIMLPGFVLAGLVREKAEQIKNARISTVITQYDPPRSLKPAEMGLLYDMRCDRNEIIATLFDLEGRGIIRIRSSTSVEVIDNTQYETLEKFEKMAVRMANGDPGFAEEGSRFKLEFVNPQTGEQEVLQVPLPAKKSRLAFSLAVQESVRRKGIAMNSYQGAFTLRVLLVALCLGLLPMLMSGSPGTLNGVEYSAWSGSAITTAMGMTFIVGFLLFPVYILSAILLVWLWTKIAGRYWMNTKQARAIWPELEGYRLYLQQVDIDNIQYESLSGQKIVTETMPYAMIFNLDTKWRERLASRTA